MFHKLLLAVDGSESSQKIVDWALNAYKENPKATFTILYVSPPNISGHTYPHAGITTAGIPHTMMDQQEWEDSQENIPKEIVNQFPDQKRVRSKVLQGMGNPATIICQEAEEGDYDAIVVGRRGYGLVSSVLIGSVSSKVLHQAPCSVIVVR